MSHHDYDDLPGKMPMPANAALIAHRAGKSQSMAFRTAVSRVLRAIASCVAQIPRRTMLRKRGDAETSDAGQWIRPRVPIVLPPSDLHMVVCDAGTIWITQGDTNDYVLNAGQSLALRPAGKVIVTAMSGPALVRHTRAQEVRRPIREKAFATNESTLHECEL